MTLIRKNRIEWRNVRLVPILHNRMEFAIEVRRQFEEFRPDRVAVEYPDTLGGKILQGVERLPLLSVVYYEDKDGAFTYLLLEPTDGQVETVRMALSEGLPIHFIDRDTSGISHGLFTHAGSLCCQDNRAFSVFAGLHLKLVKLILLFQRTPFGKRPWLIIFSD